MILSPNIYSLLVIVPFNVSLSVWVSNVTLVTDETAGVIKDILRVSQWRRWRQSKVGVKMGRRKL